MITIDFGSRDQRAIIQGAGDERAFRELRLELGSHSAGIVDQGYQQFTMPWWEFLPSRNVVRTVAEKFGLEVRIEAAARAQLQAATSQDRELQRGVETKPIPAEAISVRLREAGFHRALLSYQSRNVGIIARLSSAADFSVPGAGKTTEALAYYALRRKPSTRLLVICPKNAFSAWEEQLPLCLSDPGFFVRLTGGRERIAMALAREPRLMLIAYRQLTEVQDIVTDFLDRHECFVFVDESHHMKKGHEGVIGEAVLRMSHLPTGKLVLSGTPMPQSIRDLVPQLRFLFPTVPIYEENVASIVGGLFVRTTKKDLRLPPVTRAVRLVKMGPAQARLYELATSETARQARGLLSTQQRSAFRSFNSNVMRLLQIASNPALLGSTSGFADPFVKDAIAEGDSPKISYVCRRVRELANDGKKVIVWSMFVRNVELLSTRLADLGADYIHGGVEAGSEEEEDTREAKLRRFRIDPQAKVLIANPAACSEGISLHTVCHYALYLDRGFNAAQYIQSEERIHRIGLSPKQRTTIEIVQCPNTIDEVVASRLTAKVKRMAGVLNDDSLSIDSVLELNPEDDQLDHDDIVEVMAQIGAKG